MQNKKYKKRSFPAYGLLWLGILVGTLIPNIIWKIEWHQKAAAAMYLLGTFSGKNIDRIEYLQQVVKMRGSFFVMAAVCGASIFGVPFAVLAMILTGVKIGMLLTMSLLEFGINGGLTGVGLLFPQYLVYIPLSTYLLGLVYRQSYIIWKNPSDTLKEMKRYLLQILICAGIMTAGILLEVYCNPAVTELVLRNVF